MAKEASVEKAAAMVAAGWAARVVAMSCSENGGARVRGGGDS